MDARETTEEQLLKEINKKTLEYFNLEAYDFAELYLRGEIEDSYAASEIGFLLRCFDESFIPGILRGVG